MRKSVYVLVDTFRFKDELKFRGVCTDLFKHQFLIIGSRTIDQAHEEIRNELPHYNINFIKGMTLFLSKSEFNALKQ